MLPIDSLIAFVAVKDTGSFTSAAERLGQTPSGISRAVSRLESQLGMALITRTTRRLDLTEEGEWLLLRARKILSDLQDTEEHLVACFLQPSGTVRVNAATPVLDHLLAPLAAELMDTYPLLRLEMISGETIIDLIEERADMAIRIGNLADSTLNARRLGSSRLRLLASPEYLAQHGEPKKTEDLARHRLIGFTEPASLNIWPLTQEQGEGLPIQPAIAASSGETLRHLALNHAGIACLADFLTHNDVADGRLVPVLNTLTLPWKQAVWAVFYKQGALAPRVAAFVDLLTLRLKDGMLEP
ncbi:LysR family transcriptional regulator [Pollutimonas bauzanensis]|uniref:LysR family transcriptional regulator n=1 Tax=Pollutimonas bauzanensis TaxID=658167 RepID=UPI0033425DEC